MLEPNAHQKAENAKSLATSLLVNNPILSRETAERVAAELVQSKDGWLPWSELPKRVGMPIVIVGRDCLGFVHNATHIIGGKNPSDSGWVEDWKPVSI